MRYHLKIEDCSAQDIRGETLSVIAEGEYVGGVLCLRYTFDQAEYRLNISSDRIESLRLGDTQISRIFKRGEATCGSIKGGGTVGSLNIFTHELQAIITANGCNVKLKYSDGSDKSQTAVKNITAYAVR